MAKIIKTLQVPDSSGAIQSYEINATKLEGHSLTEIKTTYTLSKSGSRITLTGSDGSSSSINDDTGINYSLSNANKIVKWNNDEDKLEESNIVAQGSNIIVNEGTASGNYSIVGGSTDKTAISGMLGDLAAASVTVNAPVSSGNASISFGTGTEVHSTGSNAIGALNTSGVKGLYYSKIDFDKKQITLSTSRSSSAGSNLASTYGWAKDDVISFVNSNKYPACAKISAVSGNVITVDNLPFASSSDIVTYSALSSMTYTPDDFTIFACYKKQEVNYLNKITNYRWYPRGGTIELGWAATSFGIENLATGSGSHASGWNNWVAGDFGSVSGRDNIAGYAAHAEGTENQAIGANSHAEGHYTQATGSNAHAEGLRAVASGSASHAEGFYTTDDAGNILPSTASGQGAHAEGKGTTASGDFSHAEGNKTRATNNGSHAEGYNNTSSGKYAHAEGSNNEATETSAHAEGDNTHATASYAHAEGNLTTASGASSHAEGKSTVASNSYAHAEGLQTEATGAKAHAEGSNTHATGESSHTEGNGTYATASRAHAEGNETKATANNTHAEGYLTLASGHSAHAEGVNTIAGPSEDDVAPTTNTSAGAGYFSHAEGNGTWAKGNSSHAEGIGTIASGNYSHAGGKYTTASAEAQTVIGKYNRANTSALFIVGDGTSTARHNAFEVISTSNGCSIKIGDTTLTETQLKKLVAFLDTIEG